MHQLIGALVYAENEKEALKRAHHIFSRHVTFDVMDGQSVCTSRFDYFFLFDLQSAFDYLELVNKASKMQNYVTMGRDFEGNLTFDKFPKKKYVINYVKRYPHHPRFIPVGATQPIPIPAVLPANDVNAQHLMDMIMATLKMETLKILSKI